MATVNKEASSNVVKGAMLNVEPEKEQTYIIFEWRELIGVMAFETM